MFNFFLILLFMVAAGLIAARLYNRNIVKYFYFVIILFYIYPYLSDFLGVLPKSTKLVYFPIIMFPFLLNKKLLRSLRAIIPFMIYVLIVAIINTQNILLFILGIYRYVYFFMILLLLYKTKLNEEQFSIIFKFIVIIAVIQLPFNILNMLIYYRFVPGMNIVDAGGGTFGAFTSGSVGIYLVICIYTIILHKNTTKFIIFNKPILLFVLFSGLAFTYSGGSVFILIIILAMYVLRPGFKIKSALLSILLLIIGLSIFNLSHQFINKKLLRYTYSYSSDFSRRIDLGNYAISKLVNISSILLPHEDPEINQRGRTGSIIAATKYASQKSSFLIGAGAGSLNRSGALEKVLNLSAITAFDKVFGYDTSMVNSFAFLVGEVGIFGAMFIFLFIFKLLKMKYRIFSYKELKYIIFTFFMIFVFYTYYELSIFSHQFLFIWSFIVFNIDKVLKVNSIFNRKNYPMLALG